MLYNRKGGVECGLVLQVVTGGRGGIKKLLSLRYVIFEQPLSLVDLATAFSGTT